MNGIGFFNPFGSPNNSGGGGGGTAKSISFDPKGTTLTSTNVQDAIAELDSNQQISPQNIPYTNENLPGVTNLQQALDTIVNMKQEIYFSSYLNFPTIGEENILYIDKTNCVSYLWNDTTKVYESIVVESDVYEIQSIL